MASSRELSMLSDDESFGSIDQVSKAYMASTPRFRAAHTPQKERAAAEAYHREQKESDRAAQRERGGGARGTCALREVLNLLIKFLFVNYILHFLLLRSKGSTSKQASR